MVVARIHIYPVKSLAGLGVPEGEVEPWGLRHDRRWLVLSPGGGVLTARERHQLLGIRAIPLARGAIELTGRGRSTLSVEAPVDGEPLPTALARLESVRAAGREADDWLSYELGEPVRLGWLDDPRRRTVSAAHGGKQGDLLSLADAGPLLLTTTPSLRQLNDWLGEEAAERGEQPVAPMVMDRFRPNIVLEGLAAPFVEDTWSTVRIGNIEFRFAEHCDRCVLTTIDPRTLAQGKEPLRTLARHRKRGSKTYFGVRLVPLTTGQLRVGDTVTVSRAVKSGLARAGA
jgi:uncharacterized protein YcbX